MPIKSPELIKPLKTALVIGINPDYCMGGTEHYNHNLIKILLDNGFQVDYFSYNFDLKNPRIRPSFLQVNYINGVKKNSKNEKNNFLLRLRRNQRRLADLLKNHQYSIVIDSTVSAWKNEPFLNNRVFVQQFNAGFYDLDFIIGKKASYFFQFLAYLMFGRISPIIKSQYHVFFTQLDLLEFKKHWKLIDFSQSLILPIAYNNSQNISLVTVKKSNKILYLGRFENHQKNIKKIIKVSKKLDFVIDMYGDGGYKKWIIKNNNTHYMGIYKDHNKATLYRSYLATILLSRYEGFPNVLVESLTFGTPIIVLDTFPSAKFLTDNGKNGLLLDSHLTSVEIAYKINEFLNNQELLKEKSLNCLNFAKQNLAWNNFEKQWIKYLNEIIEKNY